MKEKFEDIFSFLKDDRKYNRVIQRLAEDEFLHKKPVINN
tara:strand:+ start:10742 stop:10861 length:120 start_codon:yes stop_codon:yes gene_type:complete